MRPEAAWVWPAAGMRQPQKKPAPRDGTGWEGRAITAIYFLRRKMRARLPRPRREVLDGSGTASSLRPSTNPQVLTGEKDLMVRGIVVSVAVKVKECSLQGRSGESYPVTTGVLASLVLPDINTMLGDPVFPVVVIPG